MIPSKTKAQIREEINTQVQEYLDQGGEVVNVDKGVSGENHKQSGKMTIYWQQPKQTRTPVQEEVKAIEARKTPQLLKKGPPKKPQRILITDDFGEPIRWVWQD